MKHWGILFSTLAFAASVATADTNSWVINAQIVDPADYPEVVQIKTPVTVNDAITGRPRKGIAKCTATVVGPHAILTAAHCGKEGAVTTFTAAGETYEAVLHPSPDFTGDGSHEVGVDLSIGVTTDEIENVEPVSIGGKAKTGLGITLLGFGCYNIGGVGGSDGKLRLGENVVSILDDLEMVSRQPNGSALCSGDSGGPSYVDINGATYEVGVHSQGNLRNSNRDLRTDTADSQAFLEEIAKTEEVELCGVTKDCKKISTDRYRR